MEIYILVILFVLAGVCLHMNVINSHKCDFDTVIQVVLILIIVHAAVAFTGRILPEQYRHVDWAAPFGLMYGPLLYIGYLTSKGGFPRKKKISIHVFPFLLAVPCYIVFILLPFGLRESIRFVYFVILYGVMALSWLAYTIWVVYLIGRKKETSSIEFKSLLSSVVIILFTLATFLTIMVYTRIINGVKSPTFTRALLMYLGMLCGVILIYQYTFRRFKEGLTGTGETSGPLLPKEEVEAPSSGYLKSSLTEDLMIAYSKKVNVFIESGAYLDINLSLGRIATELKIPKHHISQMFSRHYKQGFLEYVNGLRIHHACGILSDPKINVNISDLAEQCGFKSKPSFYRNFKTITGMTPTEFQSSLKKPS